MKKLKAIFLLPLFILTSNLYANTEEYWNDYLNWKKSSSHLTKRDVLTYIHNDLIFKAEKDVQKQNAVEWFFTTGGRHGFRKTREDDEEKLKMVKIWARLCLLKEISLDIEKQAALYPQVTNISVRKPHYQILDALTSTMQFVKRQTSVFLLTEDLSRAISVFSFLPIAGGVFSHQEHPELPILQRLRSAFCVKNQQWDDIGLDNEHLSREHQSSILYLGWLAYSIGRIESREVPSPLAIYSPKTELTDHQRLFTFKGEEFLIEDYTQQIATLEVTMIKAPELKEAKDSVRQSIVQLRKALVKTYLSRVGIPPQLPIFHPSEDLLNLLPAQWILDFSSHHLIRSEEDINQFLTFLETCFSKPQCSFLSMKRLLDRTNLIYKETAYQQLKDNQLIPILINLLQPYLKEIKEKLITSPPNN